MRSADGLDRPAREALLPEHADLRELLEPLLAGPEPAPSASPPRLVGRRLGGFLLGEEIGRGATGVVHAARQTSLGRDVAVKVLAARFRPAVETAARLEHRGIVRVLEVGCDHALPYVAMERIAGMPLHQVLGRLRGVPPDQLGGDAVAKIVEGHGALFAGSYFQFVARVVCQVAEALQHAHEHGVVHRSVKPSNILLRRDGQVVLTDFGLTRDARSPSLDAAGDCAGTPHYVAPEQVRGDAELVDRRCDVFALGVTLYELLTHRLPFDGVTRADVLDRVLHLEPRDPCNVEPGTPRDLAAITMHALRKVPAARYQSAREMGDDVLAWLEHRAVRAHRPSWLRWAGRRVKHSPIRAALFAVLTFGVPFSGFALWLQQRAANHEILRQRAEADARLALALDLLRAAEVGTDQLLRLVERDAFDVLLEDAEAGPLLGRLRARR